MISTFVKGYSKEVIEAGSGTEIIEICRNNPGIDLLLIDIQMPNLNGYEVTRQIRQFNKEIIIFAQIALGQIGDREKAIEAGCNEYLANPINKDALLELIHKYFRN